MGLQLKNLKKLKITVAQSPFQIGGEFINESGRINFLSLSFVRFVELLQLVHLISS